MEFFEFVKKHAGWMIIPLIWVAYYADFKLAHVKGRLGMNWLPEIVHDALAFLMTFFLVCIAVLVAYALLIGFASHIFGNVIYAVVGIMGLCFGTVLIGKELGLELLEPVNPVWHLSGFAIGFWCFQQLERMASVGHA